MGGCSSTASLSMHAWKRVVSPLLLLPLLLFLIRLQGAQKGRVHSFLCSYVFPSSVGRVDVQVVLVRPLVGCPALRGDTVLSGQLGSCLGSKAGVRLGGQT